MLWDLNEGKHLYSLEAGDVVNALVFSPNRYWLCAATTKCVKIFDLESKCVVLLIHSHTVVLTCHPGRSSTSSSRPSTSPRARASRSASPSPGPPTVRLSSPVSPTTSSVSGPSSHKTLGTMGDEGAAVYAILLCCTLHMYATLLQKFRPLQTAGFDISALRGLDEERATIFKAIREI